MSQRPTGERLFKKYLHSQRIQADAAFPWTHTQQRSDYRIEHHEAGPIVLEIKDIEPRFSPGARSVDPYKVIRDHIGAALRENLGPFREYVCAVVLYAPPGSGVLLRTPEIVLGAMYGDLTFLIPYNLKEQKFERARTERYFKVGRGKLVRGDGAGSGEPVNQRLSAIITLQESIKEECLLYERMFSASTKEERQQLWFDRKSTLRVTVLGESLCLPKTSC